MFVISLVASTVVAVLFSGQVKALSGRKSDVLTLLPWLYAFVPVCICFSASYGLSLLIMFVLTTFCYLVSARKSLFTPIAFMSVACGHLAVYFTLVREELREIESLQQSLPVTNLENSLPARKSISFPIDAKYVDEISDLQSWKAKPYLERLHQSQIQHFNLANGFGVVRGHIEFRDLNFYLPSRKPVPQPGQAFTVDSLGEIEHPITDFKDSISQFNSDALKKFAFPKGWGWQRTPKEVVAFSPHQMGEKSKADGQEEDGIPTTKSTRWSVRSIQLIGLLLAPKPRVYVTENLPRMDEAKNAPTRDLDPFEKAGLDAVGNSEKIYIGRHVSEPIIRAVGPLRASQSCVECHRCENGTLLGAFSYTLIQHTK